MSDRIEEASKHLLTLTTKREQSESISLKSISTKTRERLGSRNIAQSIDILLILHILEFRVHDKIVIITSTLVVLHVESSMHQSGLAMIPEGATA